MPDECERPRGGTDMSLDDDELVMRFVKCIGVHLAIRTQVINLFLSSSNMLFERHVVPCPCLHI